MGKAGASVDLQTRECVVVGEADLQDRQVSLEPLLLIDHQVSPAAADRFYGGTREVETGSVNIIGAQASTLKEGLLSGGQITVVGDDQFDIRVSGQHPHKDRHSSSSICISGVIDLLVDYFQARIFERFN